MRSDFIKKSGLEIECPAPKLASFWVMKRTDDHNCFTFICQCGQTDERVVAHHIDKSLFEHTCTHCGNGEYAKSLNDKLYIRMYTKDNQHKNPEKYQVVHVEEHGSFNYLTYQPEQHQTITVLSVKHKRFNISKWETKDGCQFEEKFANEKDMRERLPNRDHPLGLFFFHIFGEEVVNMASDYGELKELLEIGLEIPALWGKTELFHLNLTENGMLYILKDNQVKSLEEIAESIIIGRREKSLRRHIFEKMKLYQLAHRFDKENRYDPAWDHAVSISFSNINHVRSLIGIDWRYHGFIDGQSQAEIFEFLIEIFGEKQVAQFYVNNYIKQPSFTSDTSMLIRMCLYKSKMHLKEVLTREKLKLKPLHDALVKLNHTLEHENIQFCYPDTWQSFQMNFCGYKFCLPKDSRGLEMYGRVLHNCLSGYRYSIRDQYKLAIGMFKNGKLKNALMFDSELNLIEYKADYNEDPHEEDEKIIHLYHQKIFEINQGFDQSVPIGNEQN